MRGAFLLWTVGIAFGQQAVWEKHTREGDRLAQAGRYREAKAVYQLALRGEDMPADPGVQASMWNNLAMINRVLGNLVEARPQYRRALELIEKARGPGSSEYAGILHNLAVLDYTAGKLDEAALQFHRALKIREDVLGGNDPATAETLNSLAAVYAGQKRYAEAERLSRRALTIQEEALGPEDRSLVPTLDNLSSSHLRQSQFGEALRWKVILPAGAPHVLLLRALAEHQVSIHGFEPIKADLEGAFWSLAARKEAA